MSTQSLAARIAKAGALYFACVFGAGVVFGSLRVPFVVPRLGVRTAELLEMPLMFCVILLAARSVVRRYALPAAPAVRLGCGVLALALMLAAEFGLALGVQGRTMAEIVAGGDPVSGSVYLAMLVVFATMPLWVGRLPRA